MQSISFNGCAVDQIDAVCLPVFLFFKKLLNMCSCFLGPTVFVPEPSKAMLPNVRYASLKNQA